MNIHAFQEIYTEYQPRILAIARQRLNDHALAEEITADVFRIAWEQCRDGGTPSSPWLYKTLRNLIANQYRRHQRDLDYLAQIGRDSAESASVEDAIDDMMTIAHGLGRLGEQDREILRMAYWEDLTRSEMATILGCNIVAVRVRLSRAKNRLRAVLDDNVVPDRMTGSGN